jgi:TolB-like protein/DNA-binding winged helix-turn-helix (wHTH) protein/Tfp pilus assembly protein PilF
MREGLTPRPRVIGAQCQLERWNVFEEFCKSSCEFLRDVNSLMEKHFYIFGPYRLDPVEQVLWRADQPVPLPPKDVEMLIVLVERAGHIVEKDELLERVWPGVFIEEGNLARRVFNLRQALGDGSEGQKYIETVPRRGYRFTAAVAEEGGESSAAAQPASSADSPPVPTAPGSNARRKLWVWPLAVTVALIITASLASQHYWKTRNISSQKVMLAVLPFTNMSGDAGNNYFADGFTEEMITQLGQVQPMRLGVIARTSAMHYKSSPMSAAQICQELGVNYLLEGSVRQAGDRVRITAQLIQASDQTHLWAESYDTALTDVLQVQREIAGRITNSLRMELLPAQAAGATASSHRNPEAYRKYLVALTEWRAGTNEGMEKAIQHLQEAIAAEPKNARYYEALAQVYDAAVPYNMAPRVAVPLLKQAAQTALELDPGLAAPHAYLGDAYLEYDWNWKAAEEEYRRALALNPSSSDAQLGYSDFLSSLGRHDEALAHVQQVYLVDPLAVDYRQETLWSYFFSGRMEETIVQARKTIELEPKAGWAHALMALAYAQLGRREEAVRSADEAGKVSDLPGELAVAASAIARAGEQQKARQMLNRALDLAQRHYVCHFLLAAAYVDLDEKEKAMASLEQAYRERSN